MITIYKGEEAQRACNAILEAKMDLTSSREKYDAPIEGIEVQSAGYWEENGRYVAYDNSTFDCWVEEFSTLKEAKAYANSINQVEQ